MGWRELRSGKGWRYFPGGYSPIEIIHESRGKWKRCFGSDTESSREYGIYGFAAKVLLRITWHRVIAITSSVMIAIPYAQLFHEVLDAHKTVRRPART